MPLISMILEKASGDALANTDLPHDNDSEIDDPLIVSALKIVWTHSHRSISIDYLLDELSVNRRTLERRFQKVRGHSIYDEIMKCRFSRASRLLIETHLPIKTISYLSGFGPPERMRYAFGNLAGQTPAAFRKRHQRN